MKQSEQELISVVIPVFNVQMYLVRCIKSVLAQSYSNLEIILVDDGSTDNSSKICDEWQRKDSRIRVIHKVNGGLSDARNAGIKIATGRYITFIDSDDSVDWDMIEYLHYLLKKHMCSVSLCSHRILFEKSNKTRRLGNGREEVLNAEECIKKMCYHDCVDTSAWGKLYEREIFDNIEYPVGKLFEDIGTTYKTFYQSGKVACGYKDKYTYYVRDNSIVTSSFNVRKFDLLEMTDRMAVEVLSIYPDLKSAVLRRQLYARFSTLNQMIGIDGYVTEKNKINDFVKKYRNEVFKDKLTPMRDRLAIIFSCCGLGMYELIWRLYRKYKDLI